MLILMLIQIPKEGGHIRASESSVEWLWVGQKSLHFCVFPYGPHGTELPARPHRDENAVSKCDFWLFEALSVLKLPCRRPCISGG